MQRRRQSNPAPRPSRKPGGPRVAKALGCLALILIDGGPIRRKLKKDYEKAQNQLAKARADLDRYYKEDVPFFDQWMNRTFGALLTALRETSRQVEEAEQLVFEVEDEYMFNGGTYADAYRRVIHRRDHPEPESQRSASDDANPFGRSGKGRSRQEDDFGSDPFFSKTGDRDFDELFENIHEAFEEMFGDRPNSRNRSRSGSHSQRPGNPPRTSRLKDLYRSLVRRLHPDTQTEITAQKLEWWHQVQAAYQTGNEEQMEIILALCEIDETGQADSTSLSLLQRITGHFKAALRDIRSQLTRHRKEPAWNFSQRQDRHVLEAQIRWQMDNDLRMMKHQLQEYESVLAQWKAAAERRSSRKRARPASPFKKQFLFDDF